ncbi:SRPBCC family protein [bacterium]|nr:SRPBCC family protein [bacterium]
MDEEHAGQQSSDRIEKEVLLKAPVSRVWRALTDYQEFGEWFRVNLDGPFIAGQKTSGKILHPGYEHLRLEVDVERLEPESYFSYHWHPYAVDQLVDYSHEEPTLVEFSLSAQEGGTLLRVVESGFERIPASRRDEAYRMNSGGWAGQMDNIGRYLDSALA